MSDDEGGADNAVGGRVTPEAAVAFEIRRRREAAGLSQAELANRVGYSREYVSRAERPTRGLASAELARSLDAALDAGGALIALRGSAVHARLARRSPGVAMTTRPVSSITNTTPLEVSAAGLGNDPAPSISERAYELYLRSHGLLSTNDRQQVEAATILLDRALDIDPDFVRARAARGYARWRHYFAGWSSSPSTLDAALDDVTAALRRDPRSISALTALIRICWDKGWHERAVAAGWNMYRANPESLDATLAFSRALNNAGMADVALPLTRAVLEIDPSNPTALKLLIWNHLMVGDYLSAIQAARFYLPISPRDSNTRWAAASAHFCNGDTDEAIRIVREAASADPDDVSIWNLHGSLLRQSGATEAANAVWTAGLAHFTDRSGMTAELSLRTQIWLAHIEACLGHVRQSEARLHRVGAVEPDNGYLKYRSAHVLIELGDIDGAIHALRGAVQAGFLSIELLRHDESLALAPIVDLPAYYQVKSILERTITMLKSQYCPTGASRRI